MTREKLEGLRALDRIIEQDREQLARMRGAMEHPGHASFSGMPSGGFRDGDKIGSMIARMETLEVKLRAEILAFETERAEIYEYCMGIPDKWDRAIVVWRCVNLWSWRKIGAKSGIGENGARVAYHRWCRKNLE